MRIEGHYFDQRLSGKKRVTVRNEGLASPSRTSKSAGRPPGMVGAALI
jgi:hypothetical protein